jgi:hypothetical protein
MRYSEEAVDRTNDALGNLYHVLAGLYGEKAKHGKGYPIIAEGWVAEIFKLRKEIDDMIGLTDYVAEFGVPPTDEEIDATAPRAAPSPNGSSAPEGRALQT